MKSTSQQSDFASRLGLYLNLGLAEERAREYARKDSMLRHEVEPPGVGDEAYSGIVGHYKGMPYKASDLANRATQTNGIQRTVADLAMWLRTQISE